MVGPSSNSAAGKGTRMIGPAILEAKGVSLRFGGLTALSDFNLALRRGDLVGLIGPNGAGKTTAFNVFTGMYRPSNGEVRVGDTRCDGLRPFRMNRLGIARTFQNIRLFRGLTALDNVLIALHRPFGESGTWWRAAAADVGAWLSTIWATDAFRRKEAEMRARAATLLDVVDLGSKAQAIASSLSYGEQRRLEIARALGTAPRVLLLDEPAAGMNTAEKVELAALIRRIREEFALGILVIEHDMKLVMGICEKITVLDHGETIAVGTPEEVRAHPKVIEAYLGVEASPVS